MPNLPRTTVTDLAILLVVVADTAWEGAKKALARLRPYIEPPGDVEVRSTTGALYSGVLPMPAEEVLDVLMPLALLRGDAELAARIAAKAS